MLEALLEKYADEGISLIEDMAILNVPPFTKFGTAMQITKQFGDKDKLQEARQESESLLYDATA